MINVYVILLKDRGHMKILMISRSYHPDYGGAEVFVKEIAERSAQDGHIVLVLTHAIKGSPRTEVFNGVKIIRVSHPISIEKSTSSHLPSIMFIFPAILQAMRVVIKENISVIHCHGSMSSLCGYIIKKLFKKKLVITVQGGDIGDYPESTGGFCGVLKPVIRTYLGAADAITCVSTHLVGVAINKFGAKNIKLIPNGVDMSMFKSTDDKETFKKNLNIEEKRIIISVSRLTPKNGIDYLIRAFPEILARFSDTRLILLGGGKQEEEIKKLKRELGVQDKITLIDHVPHAEIKKYLSIADVFIRPSLDEGFGIAFIEAMACGIPVIGTNVGGIPDIIKNNENGIIIEPRNEKQIINSILNLLNNKDLAEKLSAKGHEYVKKQFNWDNIYKKMKSVYEEVI